jgi:hypothetical protein
MNARLLVRARAVRRFGLATGILALLTITGQGATPAIGAQNPITNHLQALAKVAEKFEHDAALDLNRALSSGGLQFLAIADKSEQLIAAVQQGVNAKKGGPKALPKGYASDPYAIEDFISRLTGMTQSETSAAWCGRNALIGFNDSGSFADTLFAGASPSGSLSFEGWSRSTNAGGSYTDMGPVLSDPLPAGVQFRDLFGDPVLGCTSASDFYYASLSMDTDPTFTSFTTGIAVSRSTDGGATFSSTVAAVNKDAFEHFLDKPWMAVAPGPTASPSDDILDVTYTDFDFSFSSAGCPGDARTAIESVTSTDGGDTWSSPVVVEEVCGFEPFVQGSQVEMGLGDDVYVAWEHFSDFETRDIRIARSTDGGQSFGAPVVVDAATPIGDSFELQGDFRAFIDLQGLAIDRSSGKLYITWHDGRNRSSPDPFGFCGGTATYCFGDALISSSTDNGGTWSAPVRINDDPITLATDQWFPAVDVDRAGNVWVSFYDRRGDPRNFLIDFYVAKSNNGGTKWTNTRVTQTSFAPVTGWEDFVVNPSYMGDYVAVAADTLGTAPGVIVAWGDNSLGDANVLQRRF